MICPPWCRPFGRNWLRRDGLQIWLGGHPRSEHDQQVVPNLSKDIILEQYTLSEILYFMRALPILYTCKELGWSHIGEVLRAPTQDHRLSYLRAAEQGAWSVRRRHAAMRADAHGLHTDQPWAVPPEEDGHHDKSPS